MSENVGKAFRLLQMHERLSNGGSIVKEAVVTEFGIPPKTFQRDIDSLRLYYVEQDCELLYDRKDNCYRLRAKSSKLTKEEVFAVCKILIESRAFNKTEFNEIIGKLVQQCGLDERKAVKSAIANEQINYLQLQHGKPLIGILWDLAECVATQIIIRISYRRSDGLRRSHEVKPVGIMFSEFYFYLIAYMADDSKQFPTVFRVDRVDDVVRQNENFKVPYAERFSETEFRKRVQFMYAGELKRVRFVYRGALEAILDRLPTARVEKETDNGVIIQAEAYGNGIDMWLKSQGSKVEMHCSHLNEKHRNKSHRQESE